MTFVKQVDKINLALIQHIHFEGVAGRNPAIENVVRFPINDFPGLAFAVNKSEFFGR